MDGFDTSMYNQNQNTTANSPLMQAQKALQIRQMMAQKQQMAQRQQAAGVGSPGTTAALGQMGAGQPYNPGVASPDTMSNQ